MVAHTEALQLLHKPAAGSPHLGHVGIGVGLISQGGMGRDDRHAVDVIGPSDPADPINDRGRPDRKSNAQPSQASRFGQ